MNGLASVCGTLPLDATISLLTCGVLLIFLELNRPGSIFPGAFGLLITLLGVARLARGELHPGAYGLALSGAALLMLGLRRNLQPVLQVAATLCFCEGLWLVALPLHRGRIHALVSIACGILLGGSASWLTRVARRARINKGLD